MHVQARHALLATRAPAKINLSLHVLGRRADGYHLLSSLVAFAGVGDGLSLSPGEALALQVSGPHACALSVTDDNLVLRAVRHLLALEPDLQTGHFHLVKRLPVASGMGGGSADAAAALRLMARLNGLPANDPALLQAARLTGADVLVCLIGKPCFMSGIGDVLGAPLAMPKLFAVLVNPLFPVATASVFAALGLATNSARGNNPPHLAENRDAPSLADGRMLTEWLGLQSNELEAPAMRLAPIIADVLGEMRRNPACQLARMSGSGATCFGLFADCHAAAYASRVLKSSHKNWWVKPTILR